MFQKEQQLIEDKIKEYCEANDIALAELKWQAIPFSGEWGFSTSFFQTAANEAKRGKGNKLPTPQKAQEIAEQVKGQLGGAAGISRIEAVKGYLNVYFKTSEYANRVVNEVLINGAEFGRGAAKSETVMVEYAQPNTHHSFHIGHARNTILGEVLARLVEFAGYKTIRASYPGDLGLGVVTVMWMYDKFYKGQEPAGVHERGQWLLKLYVEANQLLEKKENETPEETSQREAYETERRELYRRYDAGDPYARELWRTTREWSLEELREILHMLDVKMDVWFYESEADEPSKAIVEELIAKGIADDERPQGGAVIVKIDEKLGLTKEKYRTNVILRRDGTTLYLTKDLALAKEKFEKYHVDRSIYVVDVRQSLHLQQAFAILKLWGFPQAEKCFHLGYGFVSLPEGAMSSRKGRVVLFKEVYDEAIRRVLAVEAEKSVDIPAEEREKIAAQIGLGALAYSMLSVDNNKDIVFNIEEALSFDGRTGPYIQNAHVRANSILKKAGVTSDKLQGTSYEYELTKQEIELIEQMSRFPQKVQQAAEEYRPLVMAMYAYDLANAFHSFYHAVPVLQAEDEKVKNARLRLVAAAKRVVANALRLLDIQAPDAM
ncbi:MAG: arginine--tRNA ligase [Chloroflexi bacterium]|nr:arginine--tRNA ligase [Chloroflexi bacterium CFX1]MCK6567960.1 arginine--tRNA ligase [Anaerolineales bacterium]MCQ3953502.1 arginine--tRNA ligase [Chloroflexota bacterium]MDL1919613.1 arginine--tRNA ligase [Chloroflexi bacterium CFX5]NUQ59364.1 arginine--tRNA ligase [Anaerolineales bacterium]